MEYVESIIDRVTTSPHQPTKLFGCTTIFDEAAVLKGILFDLKL